MTYGVDQCRVCGVPIKPMGPETMARHLESQRRPLMSEAQWRAAGFMIGPTRWQLRQPADGCCPACGQTLLRRKWKPARRLAVIFLIIAGLAGFVWFGAVLYTG